jgi:replicative DNA helicase
LTILAPPPAHPLRELPNNLDAEQALLGALLFDNDALERIGTDYPSKAFFEPLHAQLFEAIADSIRRGVRAEPILLRDRFAADPAFTEFGGVRYLADLVDRAPPAANAPDYARVLLDLATRRDLHRVGEEIAAAALDADGTRDAAELLSQAESTILALGSDGPKREAWLPAHSVLDWAIADAMTRDSTVEFGTGLTEVDALIGGFNRGELSLIAGRPGMAKSTVAATIAKANARNRKGTAFFSLEMDRSPLGLRLACDLAYEDRDVVYSLDPDSANPTFDRARKNALTPAQWARLKAAQALIARERWPLLFDVRPGLTVSTIEACARRAIRKWEREGVEPGPVIIDHLGIVRPEKDRKGSKHAETADVSRALAEMAKRLDVPVIALCQLNRGVESRGDDKRPQLSDLRNAGELEEDARLIVFLLREEYYWRDPLDPDSETAQEKVERRTKLERVRNKLRWIVAKNNNGPLGEVETFCDVACSVVRDRKGAR